MLIDKDRIKNEIIEEYKNSGIDYSEGLVHLAVLVLSALDALGKFEELYGDLFIVECGKKRSVINSHELRYLIEEIDEYYVTVREFPQNLKKEIVSQEHPDLVDTLEENCNAENYINLGLIERLIYEVENELEPEEKEFAIKDTGNSQDFNIKNLNDDVNEVRSCLSDLYDYVSFEF